MERAGDNFTAEHDMNSGAENGAMKRLSRRNFVKRASLGSLALTGGGLMPKTYPPEVPSRPGPRPETRPWQQISFPANCDPRARTNPQT